MLNNYTADYLFISILIFVAAFVAVVVLTVISGSAQKQFTKALAATK